MPNKIDKIRILEREKQRLVFDVLIEAEHNEPLPEEFDTTLHIIAAIIGVMLGMLALPFIAWGFSQFL